MSEYKVPKYLIQRFNSLTSNEERAELIRQHKSWKENKITNDLLIYLQQELEREVLESDKETNFFSFFHFRFNHAYHKGKRCVLRWLLQTI